MILKGATGKDAELPFNLFKQSDGTALLDYPFSSGDVMVALAGLTFFGANVANVVAKDRGKYALQLSGFETSVTGAVYLDINTPSINGGDCQPSSWQETIVDLSIPTLNALLTDHTVAGSVGDAIAIAAGLLQGNFFMDEVTPSPNGQTLARIRLFRNAAATAAATSGGSGQGEFAIFSVETAYTAPGAIQTHRVTRTL